MPVDPHIAQVLEVMEATQAPAIHAGTPEAGRGLFVRMSRTMRASEHSASVASTEDRLVPTPAGRLRARVYRPEGRGPWPTIVFFHGGGWVVGDLETHDDIARSLCHQCDAVVVSVD
ncbi:MAG: alpha/beta hydrolase, partial [Nocardioidaceae bacterium]